MAEQEFRQQCLQVFTDHNALDFMLDQVKDVALKADWQKKQMAQSTAASQGAADDCMDAEGRAMHGAIAEGDMCENG